MFPYCININLNVVMKKITQLFRIELAHNTDCCSRCHKKLFIFVYNNNNKNEYCCCPIKTLMKTDYNSLQRLNKFQVPTIRIRIKKKIEYTYMQGEEGEQEENIRYDLSVNHKIYIKC